MADDPATVADGLANFRRTLMRPAPPVADVEEDVLADVARRGVEHARAAAWSAVCPSRFLRASLDDFADQPGVHADLTAWVEARGARPNLVISGALGVGKTHAALAAAHPLHVRGLEVIVRPTVEVLDDLRNFEAGAWRDTFEALAWCDVLVLDDLGAERVTDWSAERLYALINRRWMEERPIIATTNLDPEGIRQSLGERSYSRLVGNGTVGVRLGGRDRRRTEATSPRSADGRPVRGGQRAGPDRPAR